MTLAEPAEAAAAAPAPAETARDHVELRLVSPLAKEPFVVKISKLEPVSSVKQYLVGLGQLVQPLTAFSLRANGQLLDPLTLIGDCALEGGATVDVVPEPYSYTDAVLHVQRTRDLLGLATDAGALPAINAGAVRIVDFKTEKRKARGKKAAAAAAGDPPTLSEEHPIFQISPDGAAAAPARVPEELAAAPNTVAPGPAARGLHLSQWNPVSPRNRLAGHLLYLKFVASDSKAFHITVHRDGFFVNGSTDDKFDGRPKKGTAAHVSLLQVLAQASPSTLNAVERAKNTLAKVSPLQWVAPRNSFLSIPWLVTGVSDVPAVGADLGRTQAALADAQTLKDWNDEYQATRELPKVDDEGNMSVRDRLVREKLLTALFHDFAVAATKGATDIVEGSLDALNSSEDPDEQIFLRNGIFYTYGVDSVGTYAALGGNEAARVAVNKDLRGVEQLMRLDLDDVSPVLTAVVDYAGRRVLAQAPVPGVFRETGESLIAYGATEGREQVVARPAFAAQMERIAEEFRVKPHAVADASGNETTLDTSVDVKGMVGTDGRSYLLDLARMAPPDLAFLESVDAEAKADPAVPAYPHKMVLLRPEAVAEWFQQKVRTALADEPEGAKVSDERARELARQFRLNPDVAHVEGAPAADRADVLEASQLVKDRLIPQYLEDLRAAETVYPVDGAQLALVLHRRGINLRYLGALYAAAEGEIFANLRLTVAQEAIARAVKHIVNRRISRLPLVETRGTIAEYLSAVRTGSDAELLAELKNEVRARFRLILPDSWTTDILPRASLLRAVSLALGLQWDAALLKDGAAVDPAALVAVVPRVRYAAARSVIASEALDAGRVSLHNGDAAVGLELVGEALSLFEQIYGGLHADTAQAYNQAALLYYEHKDHDKAAELGRLAITAAERVLGLDAHEVLVMYVNLAFYERARGNVASALALSKHVVDLWTATGFEGHPDTATTLNSVALLLQQARHYAASLPWFDRSLAIHEGAYGGDSTTVGAYYYERAQSQLMVNDYKAAARSMERSYGIYRTARGPEDASTVEIKGWLDKLLAAAVKDNQAKRAIAQHAVAAPKAAAPPKLAASAATPATSMAGRSINDIVAWIQGDDAKAGKKKGKKGKKAASPN